MQIYLNQFESSEVLSKLENQALLTKTLYFWLVSIANLHGYPIDYSHLRTAMQPREEEEVELARSFKFLTDSKLVSFHTVSEVGHG